VSSAIAIMHRIAGEQARAAAETLSIKRGARKRR
jgi:hypothetical protein